MLWNLSEYTCKSSLTQLLPKREGHPHHPTRFLFFIHDSWITSTGSHQQVREVVGDLSQERVAHPWQRRSTIRLLCTWMELLRVTLPLSVRPAFNSPHPHTQPLLPFDHPSVWAAVSSFLPQSSVTKRAWCLSLKGRTRNGGSWNTPFLHLCGYRINTQRS